MEKTGGTDLLRYLTTYKESQLQYFYLQWTSEWCDQINSNVKGIKSVLEGECKGRPMIHIRIHTWVGPVRITRSFAPADLHRAAMSAVLQGPNIAFSQCWKRGRQAVRPMHHPLYIPRWPQKAQISIWLKEPLLCCRDTTTGRPRATPTSTTDSFYFYFLFFIF